MPTKRLPNRSGRRGNPKRSIAAAVLASSRRREQPAKPEPATAEPPKRVLTPEQHAFVLAYDRHLGNGTRAWLELHPNVTVRSAATEASRMLRNVDIRNAVHASREARWARLKMEGDEALALVALHARADARELYDEKGDLLPPHLWPDDLRLCIDSVDYANGKVKLVSKGAAVRTLLEQTGKLTGVGDGIGMLARLLAGKFDETEVKP